MERTNHNVFVRNSLQINSFFESIPMVLVHLFCNVWEFRFSKKTLNEMCSSYEWSVRIIEELLTNFTYMSVKVRPLPRRIQTNSLEHSRN